MMKTEVKLGAALKELMASEPIDKITVKRLTDICDINRQTFYYHFRDIYDLLTWIYLNESVKEMENVSTWKEAIRAFLGYIQKNSTFIKNTLSSAGRDLFINFLYSSIYNSEMRIISKADTKSILTTEDRRFVAAFVAPGLVATVVRWVENDMKESSDSLIRHLDILMDGYVHDIIRRFAKNKGLIK